jgi:hypothetical protein
LKLRQGAELLDAAAAAEWGAVEQVQAPQGWEALGHARSMQ